ncbi:barstar family protein [Clostridium hydrogenum]|uniref:barstar family protein n=1 Tax=Clostridium hydrogenum TaxID=2855764 RepID=UPI001F371817|nr:barstar family protein [Clostridium hydrogenum]
MKTIVIEGKNFKDRESFHAFLKLQMNFPEYYGNNLDALWDCLTGEIKLPLKIVWKNFNISKITLGDYADKAAELFIKAEKALDKKFIFEIIN